MSINIKGSVIRCSRLGITIVSDFTFKEHNIKLGSEANQKLS